MSYATQQNLVDRFGEEELLRIADRDQDGSIDAAVVAKALADADAEIDSYIGKVYVLPLAEVPARVKDLAADIGLYKLYPSNPPEDVVRRYKDAVAFLVNVAKGLAVLPIASGAPAPPAGGGVGISAPDRVFTSGTLEDF